MNILIPDSWLRDFVKTGANPPAIAEKLSLCALSVEKLHKRGGETVYEIETTPNRGDTLSVLGVAREVAAVLPRFGLKAELTPPNILGTSDTPSANLLDIALTDPALCPRFTAIVLDRVEIKSSPKIIKDRLEMSGIRSLNNVVDVSNYLMLELGQPMHIFDFDKLTNGQMALRKSEKGEKLVTLDGVGRELPKGAIVIESGGGLIDLCGIMGGKNSEVDEKTQRILLFIQIYDPVRIRKTSKVLALRTEASTRFEKGIDPQGVIPAMSRAIKILKEHANARVASKLVDIQNDLYTPRKIELEIPKVESLIGVRIEREQIIEILKSLGFEVKVQNSGFEAPSLEVTVPSWRAYDVAIAEDLIEEIARLYGYYNLQSVIPGGEIPKTAREKKFYWEDKAKDFLKHQGFLEVCNYSFVSKDAIESSGLDPKQALKIKNPLNLDLEYLRPSLLPSLLQNLTENRHHQDKVKFFELERVYIPTKNQDLPRENFRLTGLVHNDSFYVVKGIIEGLLKELGVKHVSFAPQEPLNAAVRSGSTTIGLIGPIDPAIITFDLDFDIIANLASDLTTYEPVPEYPPLIEDLSVVLPPKTYVVNVVREIKKQSRLIRSVEVTDIYPEKGSVTFRITYQSEKRTLTEKEVEKVRQKIIRTLKTSLGADVRA